MSGPRVEKVTVFGLWKTVRMAMINSGCQVTGRFDGDVIWFRASANGAAIETGIKRQTFDAMGPADAVRWVLDFRWAWDREYGHLNHRDIRPAEHIQPLRYHDD